MGLEELYDEPTLRAIDRDQPRRSTSGIAGWRGAVVAGALNAAVAGVRAAVAVEVIDPGGIAAVLVEQIDVGAVGFAIVVEIAAMEDQVARGL